MGTHITKSELLHSAADATQQLFGDWFDPIEMRVREHVRGFIEELIETELAEALARPRYGRAGSIGNAPCGQRNGHRSRTVMGTFGRVEINVPRARLYGGEGKTTEWKSKTLPAYQRRTQAVDALIAGAYLAGTNTRRVRRALATLFNGAIGKDVVSRVWRKAQGRLASLEQSLARRRADHTFDSRWHRGAGEARQEGHVDFASGGAWHPR